VPAEQAPHSVAPVLTWKRPTLHAVQDTDDAPEAYVPASQSVHELAPSDE